MAEDIRVQRRRERWDRLGQKSSPVAAAHLVYQGRPVDCYDELADEYTRRLALQPTDRALEVGCGSGCLLLRLQPRVREIVGTDFSAGMLEHLEGKGVEHHCCEASGLPFPDASFDKVFCHGVVQSFPDQAYATRAVHEMLRVCRPGGRVLIGDVINGLLEEQYKREGLRTHYPGLKRLWKLARHWLVRPLYDLARYGQVVDQGPLFLSPFFFQDLFQDTPHQWAPLLETVKSKPIPFLRYRYDVLVVKEGAAAASPLAWSA